MTDSYREEYARYVETMKRRTKGLALEAIRIVRGLPRDDAARVIGRQLLRSSCSVGANYRAACRVRTPREFAAKIRIVCEESDETQYWGELLSESHIASTALIAHFHSEITELTAIFTRALETAKRRIR